MTHSAVIIFPEPEDSRAAHNYMAIYVTASIVKRRGEEGAFVLLSTARENCERCFFRDEILREAHAIRIHMLTEFFMRRTKTESILNYNPQISATYRQSLKRFKLGPLDSSGFSRTECDCNRAIFLSLLLLLIREKVEIK